MKKPDDSQQARFRVFRGSIALPLRALILVVAGLLSLTISCRSRGDSFGVVVAPTEYGKLQLGSVVTVEEYDHAVDAFEVSLAEGDTEFVLKPYQIRIFETETSARGFVEKSSGTLGQRAFAGVNALRVHERPGTDPDVIYRLRTGEKVQLISATNRTDTINGTSGRWYEVLAGGKYRGYVFGPLLREAPGRTEGNVVSSDRDAKAPFLHQMERSAWWPEDVKGSFLGGGIDLTAIRFEADAVEVRSNDTTLRLPLSRATVRDSKVVFPDQEISFSSPTEESMIASWQFPDQFGVEKRCTACKIVPLEKFTWRGLWQEYDRRRRLVEQLGKLSQYAYQSESYGDLHISGPGTVVWRDRDALVPNLFPSASGQDEFQLKFSPVLSAKMRRIYEGAVVVDVPSTSEDPAFLVEVLPRALRLVLVPDFDPANPLIREPPMTPFIMYFEAQENPSETASTGATTAPS